MKLRNTSAEFFVPDAVAIEAACARTTHMGIGAHQDDLEIMAFRGIVECFDTTDQWFMGVTCTNGSGSARTGPYANYSDEEMQAVRRKEQRQAAVIGRYSAIAQLDYSSAAIKDAAATDIVADLNTLLRATKPLIVYTHNPCDKHDTHVAVVVAALQAMRALPAAERPKRVLGCEIWRDLDWMLDQDKVPLDVSERENLAMSLLGLFDSQISGGKRYDLATLGKRRANATFFQSHGVDEAEQLIFGMDLTPLVEDDGRDIVDFVCDYIDRFRADVRGKIGRRLGWK